MIVIVVKVTNGPSRHLGMRHHQTQKETPRIPCIAARHRPDRQLSGLRHRPACASTAASHISKSGQYLEMIETFAPLIRREPNDQRLNLRLGMSNYGLCQHTAASAYLKKAAASDDINLTLLLTLIKGVDELTHGPNTVSTNENSRHSGDPVQRGAQRNNL